VYAVYGLSLPGVFIIALVPFLMALLVIDLQHLILPNRLVLIVGVMGFLRLITEGFILETINPVLIGGNYILGAALYAGTAWLLGWIMTVVLRKDALGFGDVKFFAVAGLWLGVLKLADFCILSGILGVILALAWQQIKKEKVFPFGPALIIALFVLLLVDGSLFA
jgi:leader peptidase (prepilin peptidase)/N-methyltransferase